MSVIDSANLILRDDNGTYYEVSQAVLEQCRVPAERVAELERQLGETDVQAYLAGLAAGGGSDNPMESLAFNFTQIPFSQPISAPRDPQSGMATGRRMH